MERHSSISSFKYNNSSGDNTNNNSDMNITKLKEVLTSLDKTAKAIIIPILKIKKKISMKFDVFAKDYTEIKDKADSVKRCLIIKYILNYASSFVSPDCG